MIPTVAAPNVQMPPPSVEASLVSGQISDPAVGRLPFNTVPPPINGQKVVDNNNREQQPARSDQDKPAPSTHSAFASFFPGKEQAAGAESGFSTPFIAQLFGQLPASDKVIGSLFGEGTGIASGFVDFNRLAEFNEVKYKPSHAFEPHEKPAQQKALEAFSTADAADSRLEKAAQAAQAEQTRPAEEQLAADVPSTAGTIAQTASTTGLPLDNSGDLADAAAVSPKREVVTSPQVSPASTQSANSKEATLFASGVDAYHSTQSRNQASSIMSTSPRGRTEVSLVL